MIKKYVVEEDGMGVVEIVLIMVVLIAMVVEFRPELL